MIFNSSSLKFESSPSEISPFKNSLIRFALSDLRRKLSHNSHLKLMPIVHTIL